MEIEPPTPCCRGESRGSSPAPHSLVPAILSSFFIPVHGLDFGAPSSSEWGCCPGLLVCLFALFRFTKGDMKKMPSCATSGTSK
jgi:hypothetical protein